MKKSIFVFLLSFSFLITLSAQEALKSTEEEYYDFLSLQGLVERPSLGYRTLSDSSWHLSEDTIHLWQKNSLGNEKVLWESDNQGNNWFSNGFYHGLKLKIYGPEWFNSYNTLCPYGQNDGALWQGAGYNTSFTTGLRLEAFGIEATFKPQITFSQNKNFEYLPGVYGDSHSYFWAGNIDLVQRYGDTSYWQYDWGDSEIRYTFHNFTVGFGTQSPWLGPAQLNPMLGSNNAGSYPKFDIGLRKTALIIPGLKWNLGNLEARVWIGQLTESNYFNHDGITDKNLLNGFNLSFSPSFWDGLTIGATKVCLTRWGNNFWKYLNPLYSSNDIYGVGEDQKASVYIDILVPQVAFEAYLEAGVDDYTKDPVSNFLHTFIYTVGFKKDFVKENKFNIKAQLYGELNFFEMSQDFQLQWNYMGYYSHGQISEGYTQNGQIIGAGSAYFGNSQMAGLKLYFSKGLIDIFFQRNVPDENEMYNKAVWTDANSCNQYYAITRAYLNTGIKSEVYVSDNFIIGNSIVFSYADNAMYKNDTSLNVHLEADFKIVF